MCMKSISFIILLIYLSNSLCKDAHFLKSQLPFEAILTQITLKTKAVTTTTSIGALCFLNSNGTIYNLNPLMRSSGDYNQTINNAINNTKDNIYINFCGPAKNNCPNKTASASYRFDSDYKSNSTKSCYSLTGNSVAMSNYTITFDNITNITRLKTILPPGDTCISNTSLKYTLAYTFVCTNSTDPNISFSNVNINNCNNEIVINTKEGNNYLKEACPKFDIYGLWNAIMANKYIFGSIILVLGVIMAFMGNKFLMFTEIMTGVILVLFFTLYFVLSNISITLSNWQFWLIVGVASGLGALVGYFISSFGNHLAAMILAGMTGYIGGQFLYQIALKYIDSNPVVVYWCVIVGSIIVCALIGYWLADQIIIIVTSIIGGYGVIRGAAFMIGSYPDEKQVYDLINNKEWTQVNALFTWQIYIYFLFFVIIAISGIYVQCKYFNDKEEDKNKSDGSHKQPLVSVPQQSAHH